MLLTFSKEKYMERILAGTKIHTIRLDPHARWRPGMTAHMWMHSPRNKTKNPFQFATSKVSYVLPIEISEKNHTIVLDKEVVRPDCWNILERIAKCDGFDSATEFFDHFGEFKGRIIYWNELRSLATDYGQLRR